VYVVGGVPGNDVAESFGTVTIFTRNPGTGELSDSGCLSSDGTDDQDGASGSCTPTPGLLGADGVTVSADGRTVFVTARASASVVAFARNPATGSLTLLGCYKSTPRPGSSCASANIFNDAEDPLTSANDSALFVASSLEGVISSFTAPPAAPASGAATTASGATTSANSSAALASLFTLTAQQSMTNPCIAVNGYDGSCAVGVAMKGVQALTLSPEGSQLYAVATASKAIDVFSLAGREPLVQTGCVMADAPAGLCNSSGLLQSPTQIAISPDGRNAYVADSGRTEGRIDVFARDATSGGLTDVGCVDNLPPSAKPETSGEEEQEEKQEREEREKTEQEQERADTCVRAPGLESVHTIAISGDGSAVYAFGASSAVSFARDPSTGKLTETACASSSDTRCASLPDLDGIEATAVSPDGQDVYAVGDGAVIAFGLGASVTGAQVSAAHGDLARVSVACPAALARPCRGRVVLTRRAELRTRRRHGYGAVRVAVGRSGLFAIAAGGRALVAVRLDRSASRLLSGHRRLGVTAIVSASRFSGGSGFGRALVLASPRR
jgi:DNA-binding beta-propeller fold protein YncE